MPKRNIIWVLAIAAAAVLAMLVTRSKTKVIHRDRTSSFDPVCEVLENIERAHLHPADLPEAPMQRYRGMVRGFVEALDEFSSYIPPDQAVAFRQRMDGLARGWGLSVELADGKIVVSHVAYHSPAGGAGLRIGQRIIAIGNDVVVGGDIDLVRLKLAGGDSDVMEVTVQASGRAMRTVRLSRAENFPVESVTGLYRDEHGRWVWTFDDEGSPAYIHIREFIKDTPQRLQEAFRSLGDSAGLVLDLRDNPGGRRKDAVSTADLFLREGKIVKFVDSAGQGQWYLAHGQDTLDDIPMVVLIDQTTASGAEIVAGALWANHRAVLVGTRSRGKGCVQSILDLGDYGLVNLTTSWFLLDRLGQITRTKDSVVWGVNPHVEVKISPVQSRRLATVHALAELPADPPARSASSRPAVGDIAKQIISADAQLGRAIALFKRPGHIADILRIERTKARRLAEEQAAKNAGDKPETSSW